MKTVQPGIQEHLIISLKFAFWVPVEIIKKKKNKLARTSNVAILCGEGWVWCKMLMVRANSQCP